MPIGALSILSSSELKELICGEDTIEWERQQLLDHLHPQGTLNSNHAVYLWLIEILLEFEHRDRQRFLDFVTSCPRLPPGGIHRLHIEICGLGASESKKASKFPYSRACSSQLYLPSALYTSQADLKKYLTEAMWCSVGNHEKTQGN